MRNMGHTLKFQLFNMFYKRVPCGSKDYTEELKNVECSRFLGQTS